MVALMYFISRLKEQGLLLFKLLRGSTPFEWIKEAHESLDNLKAYLTSPPIMVAPDERESVLLYIIGFTTTLVVVSMVLIVECP